MTETPTSPGWYWLQHAVFRGQAGIWHELHPMIVELSRNDNGPLMISVCGDDRARSVDDLVVGEWVGRSPRTPPVTRFLIHVSS